MTNEATIEDQVEAALCGMGGRSGRRAHSRTGKGEAMNLPTLRYQLIEFGIVVLIAVLVAAVWGVK